MDRCLRMWWALHSIPWLCRNSVAAVAKEEGLAIIIKLDNPLSSFEVERVQPSPIPLPIIIQDFYIPTSTWILGFGRALCHTFFALLWLFMHWFCFWKWAEIIIFTEMLSLVWWSILQVSVKEYFHPSLATRYCISKTLSFSYSVALPCKGKDNYFHCL